MSISAVGSTPSNATALEQKFKTDKQTLSQDETKKASQATIESDQAKVTADQQAIHRSQHRAASKPTQSAPAAAQPIEVNDTNAVESSQAAASDHAVDISA
jgi:hypothetical protein